MSMYQPLTSLMVLYSYIPPRDHQVDSPVIKNYDTFFQLNYIVILNFQLLLLKKQIVAHNLSFLITCVKECIYYIECLLC